MVYLAEFVGTAILTLLGCGVVAGVTLARSKAEGSGWIVITFGWGLAVTVAVYVVGQYSGAHINPAVTFAMASIGELGWAQVPGYIAAQLLGAFFGAVLAWVVYLPHWRVTEDPVVKLGVFSTIPAVRSIAANFATEVIGTFLLIFGILGINANMNPIGAGGGGLQDLFGTGFAPLLVASSSWRSACPWAGPPATPSTRRATWARASPTRCCPSPARGPRTGPTPGCRSWRRSSARSWRRRSTCCWGSRSEAAPAGARARRAGPGGRPRPLSPGRAAAPGPA